KNLMEELAKVVRLLEREAGVIDNVMLVVDATTGQNGIVQAEAFVGVAPVNGIILTKMDGTAKGGVVAAIEHETQVPVRFIGVGESMDDLLPFEPAAFVDALLE
ncbi:MAG: signal recognition particle-docking protein FtsY, partial [Acidimicrobiia bacterium]|nr:signal recognition particle-docking protein FtsY [Acidimicrobiia bacterium]